MLFLPTSSNHGVGSRFNFQLRMALSRILTAVASVGYAVGPWAVGWMYDQHGTYRYAFASLIGLSIASATLLTWVQPTYRNQLVRGA